MTHTSAYKHFKKTIPLESISSPELLARLFLKAAGHMEEIMDAMEKNDIERRFLISQTVSDFFSQLSSYLDAGTSPEQRRVYQTLKTYCSGVNILLPRMNFKNDRAIAAAIQKSLIESAQILRQMVNDHAQQKRAESEEPNHENAAPLRLGA